MKSIVGGLTRRKESNPVSKKSTPRWFRDALAAATLHVCEMLSLNVPRLYWIRRFVSYLPISRCWRGGNCWTSWTNSATFGCDSDCCPCSFSLAHRDNCMTCEWRLALDERFLNRPYDCMKHTRKTNSMTDCFCLADLVDSWYTKRGALKRKRERETHRLNIHYLIVQSSNMLSESLSSERSVSVYDASAIFLTLFPSRKLNNKK